MYRLAYAAVAALAMMASMPAAAQDKTFVFTAIPDEDETKLVERFGKVATYLEKTLSVRVKYVAVKSYPAAVTAFVNDQVQLAWFGGLTGVQAKLKVPGSEALAQGIDDPNFKSYFIAHSSAGVDKGAAFPAGLAGKTFTFGSRSSTSGRLMPEFYIRENTKQAPEQFFSRIGFSGDHSQTIALVQSGAYEAGAVSYLVWESELKAGKIDVAKVKVVWETPTYPDYHWVIRGDVDKTVGAGFKEKLRAALTGLKEPGILASFDRKAFIPAKNEDFKPIESVGRSVGLIE